MPAIGPVSSAKRQAHKLLLPCSLAPSLSAFKRVYGDVITRSRDRGADDDERLLGQERSQYVQCLPSSLACNQTPTYV